jgi:hypothetical protein
MDTGSIGLALCLFGGDMTKDGMEPLTIVMSFDVDQQFMANGIPLWVACLVHEFDFGCAKAAFHRGFDALISVEWLSRAKTMVVERHIPGSCLVQCHGISAAGYYPWRGRPESPPQDDQSRSTWRDPSAPFGPTRPLWRAKNPVSLRGKGHKPSRGRIEREPSVRIDVV